MHKSYYIKHLYFCEVVKVQISTTEQFIQLNNCETNILNVKPKKKIESKNMAEIHDNYVIYLHT